MSTTATQVSVDAAAQQRMLHELRQFRDAEQFPNTLPPFRLRKGVITARDPATSTCTVLFGAADESDFGGEATAGVRLADTVYPMVGAVCFVVFNGPDPTVLYTVGVGVGRCRLGRSTALPLTHNTPTPIPLDLDGGTYYYDSDGMLGGVGFTDRVYPRWPGNYDITVGGGFAANATGRRFVDCRHADGTSLCRFEPGANYSTTAGVSINTSTQFSFSGAAVAAGVYVSLTGYQSSGGPLDFAHRAEFDPVLAMRWAGPP